MALKRIKLNDGTYVDIKDADAYVKPSNGIPKTDFDPAVQTSLEKADSAYQKPSGGIPKSDLASAVQNQLVLEKSTGTNSVKSLSTGLTASGNSSVALGVTSDSGAMTASGDGAMVQGHAYGSEAYIGATGAGAKASGKSDGGAITASEEGALAHGYSNVGYITANKKGAVAVGYVNGDTSIRATGTGSFSHGYAGNGTDVIASGNGSHAEGTGTDASGDYSHAEGKCVVANNESEHSEGKFNVSNKKTNGTSAQNAAGSTIHSVGIGNSINDRKNAFEIMQNGDMYVKGIGGYDGTNAGTSGVHTLVGVIGDIETILATI